MKIVSAAGEFDISVERVEVRQGALVVIGKMGIWEAETFIEQEDVGHLINVSLNPRLIGWVLMQPFAALRRWLRHQSK